MTIEELEILWKDFGEIPVNNNDETEEDFIHFEKGTQKIDIWQSFEEQNEKFSIADKLYK